MLSFSFSVRVSHECQGLLPAMAICSPAAHFGFNWTPDIHNGVVATIHTTPLRSHSRFRHSLLYRSLDQGETILLELEVRLS